MVVKKNRAEKQFRSLQATLYIDTELYLVRVYLTDKQLKNIDIILENKPSFGRPSIFNIEINEDKMEQIITAIVVYQSQKLN